MTQHVNRLLDFWQHDRLARAAHLFGQPQQNTNNAYVARQAQFAFRLGF